MSLANDLAKSKYRPHHRNAKGFAAAGISVRDDCPPWLSHRSLTGRTGRWWWSLSVILGEQQNHRVGLRCEASCKACSLMAALPSWKYCEERVLVCLAATVKGPVDGPVLPRNVGGGWMSRALAFSVPALPYMHIPSSLGSAVPDGTYFQRGKEISFLPRKRHPYLKEATPYGAVQQMINSSHTLLSGHKHTSFSTSELSSLFFQQHHTRLFALLPDSPSL